LTFGGSKTRGGGTFQEEAGPCNRIKEKKESISQQCPPEKVLNFRINGRRCCLDETEPIFYEFIFMNSQKKPDKKSNFLCFFSFAISMLYNNTKMSAMLTTQLATVAEPSEGYGSCSWSGLWTPRVAHNPRSRECIASFHVSLFLSSPIFRGTRSTNQSILPLPPHSLPLGCELPGREQLPYDIWQE
jgi:hypothetical protein